MYKRKKTLLFCLKSSSIMLLKIVTIFCFEKNYVCWDPSEKNASQLALVRRCESPCWHKLAVEQGRRDITCHMGQGTCQAKRPPVQSASNQRLSLSARKPSIPHACTHTHAHTHGQKGEAANLLMECNCKYSMVYLAHLYIPMYVKPWKNILNLLNRL